MLRRRRLGALEPRGNDANPNPNPNPNVSTQELRQNCDDAPGGSEPLDALHALARGRGRGGLKVAGAAEEDLDRTATHARLQARRRRHFRRRGTSHL